MKLGFVTGLNPRMLDFAAEAGFDGVEALMGAWCGGPEMDISIDNAKRAKEQLDKKGIRALTVSLGEDLAAAADPVARMGLLFDTADIFQTKMVTANVWLPKGLSVDDKFAYYKKVWGAIAKLAEDRGLKVAIENCPHGGMNLGNCPESFRRMFDLVPSKAIGLEFDPSHYIFQFMDYLPAIREFGERIYAFHAKDTQIMYDKLNAVGIYGDQYYGHSWWRFRMPGYGDANWDKIFQALSDVKYDGDIIIEHEDPTYAGEEGLRRGCKFLRQYIL